MTGPALDEERERLSRIGDELEEDRRKFTEAALKLGKEKAALEASSLCFFTLEIILINYEGGKDQVPGGEAVVAGRCHAGTSTTDTGSPTRALRRRAPRGARSATTEVSA